jgi:hypothetical protein
LVEQHGAGKARAVPANRACPASRQPGMADRPISPTAADRAGRRRQPRRNARWTRDPALGQNGAACERGGTLALSSPVFSPFSPSRGRPDPRRRPRAATGPGPPTAAPARSRPKGARRPARERRPARQAIVPARPKRQP